MQWGPQQESALKAIRYWLKHDDGRQVFVLFGSAGTGKSTIAKEVVGMVNGRVLFAAFTGKAAMVMRSKGCDGASTIHSLIYKPMEGVSGTQFVLNKESELADAELLILDECSMVDDDMGQDLLSFGTKILVLGDPNQLPPIKGTGFFTHGEFKHDAVLTEVHRQARDNPIIRLAEMAMKGERIPFGDYGECRVIPRDKLGQTTVLAADQLIVGRNATRTNWNAKVRAINGMDPGRPERGDKLICLKNNAGKGFYNGAIWTLDEIEGRSQFYALEVSPEELIGEYSGPQSATVRREFFEGREAEIDQWERRETDEFTYGYAITCHKSQGSEWKSVVVFNEGGVFREDAPRWLYTALTRASEKIVLVQP